jgi:hypothetical protein
MQLGPSPMFGGTDTNGSAGWSALNPGPIFPLPPAGPPPPDSTFIPGGQDFPPTDTHYPG